MASPINLWNEKPHIEKKFCLSWSEGGSSLLRGGGAMEKALFFLNSVFITVCNTGSFAFPTHVKFCPVIQKQRIKGDP